MKAVFFDRDGVINEVIWRDNVLTSPRAISEWKLNIQLKPIMLALKEKGYLLFVVTNQPEVKRKLVLAETVEAMHQDIRQQLPIDAIEACFHDNEDHCNCRKPMPGMLLNLAKAWDIDLTQSFMLGDTWKDMHAGKAAGCKTILLQTTYNQAVDADYQIQNLEELLEII